MFNVTTLNQFSSGGLTLPATHYASTNHVTTLHI